jgi:16S rRNA (guanine527-N7)-methyltransferase
MAADLAARLDNRAHSHRLDIPNALSARLVAYYELLTRWNQKINLTSLTDVDAAIDRLLLEPLLAARLLPGSPNLMDLGSGGGSPAIPLALALEAPRLVMVESRGRKAAFLREAARLLGINAVVEACRFEELAGRPTYRGSMDVVSVRAVRLDEPTIRLAQGFAKPGGTVALFTSADMAVGESTLLVGSASLVRLSVPRET